jgi:outer membrane protein assembly factor BamB
LGHSVIDLGEVPATGRSAATPASRPPVPYRAVLGALSPVLVALLAGAELRPPPRPPTVIPAHLADATYLAGDRLFVVGAGVLDNGDAVTDREISTYALPDAELIARATVPVPGAVIQVQQVGGTLLVGYQLNDSGTAGVVATAAGTGRRLWQRTARLIATADGIALLSDDHAAFAVDLATGALRWRVPRPAGGYLVEAGPEGNYPRWLVLVTDAGPTETRDAHTGRLLARRTLPAPDGWANRLIWPAGDLLLVDAGGAGFDGYRLPSLERVWRTTADLSQSWMLSECGVALCIYRQQSGVTALDPATGRQLWTSERWADATPVGNFLVATPIDQDLGGPKLWVLDPATGQILGNFGDWQGVGPAGDGLIYGKLDVRGTNDMWYGVLDPATRRVRILGRADRVSGGCESGTRVMICRLVDASVAVWRLE